MQSLDISVDHRLWKFVRSWERPFLSNVSSAHVETFNKLAVALGSSRDKPVREDEINFALDLARPATVGGLVICLLQPRRGQTYSDSLPTT
jgi:hypothetical protein